MGQPTRFHRRVSAAEYIGGSKRTRGTETSKYPQEEKTTVILLVAVSERGTAQTGVCAKACKRCTVGVVGVDRGHFAECSGSYKPSI